MKKSIILFFSAILLLDAGMLAQNPLPSVKEYGFGVQGQGNYSLQYRWGTPSKLNRVMVRLGGNTSFGNSSSKNTSKTFNGTNYDSTQAAIQTKNQVPLSLNFGIGFSSFRLKALNEKFGLMYGPQIGLNYWINSSKSEDLEPVFDYQASGTTYAVTPKNNSSTQIIGLNIGLALGVYYQLNTSFFVYAELGPNVYYNFTINERDFEQEYYVPGQTSPYQVRKQSNSSTDHSIGVANFSNWGAMITLAYRITK